MRVAILGAGSIGTVIGALMTKCGKQVDFYDASKVQVDALNEKGATITGCMEINVPVHAFTPAQMSGKYDILFLLTKLTDNHAALPQLLSHLHEESVVCTLQNGIPEEAVAAYVGRERTIGGVVGFGATWLRPGVSALTSNQKVLQKFAFEIGEMDGAIRPRLSQVKEYLNCVGRTKLFANPTGIRWTKLFMDAVFSGMSAALGCTYGAVLHDPKAMTCVAYIADECIKVSQAQGIRLVEMQGEDMSFFELKSAADIQSKMPLYKKIWGPHVKLKASMLQDLEKGHRSEIDYINGLICSKGREYGVPTPFNDKVVELVHEAQKERSVNVFDSLSRFDELVAEHARNVTVTL